MDLSHTVRKILGVLTLGLGISFGQKIVHMNGTYDLDGDALLEFIALEFQIRMCFQPLLGIMKLMQMATKL